MQREIVSLFAQKPDWLTTGSIPLEQAQVIAERIVSSGARRVVEIGAASGFSTLAIAAALERNGEDWSIDSIDIGTSCYFNPGMAIGQAFTEIRGRHPNVRFHTSSTSLDLPALLKDSTIDFVYIDGSHSSPWAAIDLLSVLSNLRPGAFIALDDIILPLQENYRAQNAGRDLFRVWRGEKRIDVRAPNLGILTYTNLTQSLGDVASCLIADWDEPITDEIIERISELLGKFRSIKYRNRDECSSCFSPVQISVEKGNQYINVSKFPFLCDSILHPNSADEAPSVTWRGLKTEGRTSLHLRALAFNEHPDNRGAILQLKCDGREQDELVLKPRQISFTDIRVPANASDFDLEISISRQPGESADFAGVRVGPFFWN